MYQASIKLLVSEMIKYVFYAREKVGEKWQNTGKVKEFVEREKKR